MLWKHFVQVNYFQVNHFEFSTRPKLRSFGCLGPSLWQTAYVPLLGGSSPNVVQNVGPIHKAIQMIGTESLIDCLRTSFKRIRSRRSSRVWPIQRSCRWLGPSLWWTAYMPLLGGSSLDVVQEFDLSKDHADDWDWVYNRLPTDLFLEDQVKT